MDKVQKSESWLFDDNYLGEPVSGWSISAEVAEIIYRQEQVDTGYDVINKTTYPIYRYFVEDQKVKQDILETDTGGNADYQWVAEESKTYRSTFSVRGTDGRQIAQQYYLYGGPFSYFGFYEAQGVMLKNIDENKSSYRIGDAMQLQMQSIGGGGLESSLGRFIFLRMAGGIISYQVTDSPNYNDTFNESYIPNVEVVGAWFSGTRFMVASAGMFNHSVNFAFESEERRLNVEVVKDKKNYRPRDRVNLNIRVTDRKGNPKQAKVNVVGIDEAVFSLWPNERDIAKELYRNVLMSIIVRTSHVTPVESDARDCGCFVRGTMILTPRGERPIESLWVGDEILTRESETSPEFVKTKIEQVGSYLVDGYIVLNGKLRLTSNYQLLVNNSWKRAGETGIGDILVLRSGKPEKVVLLGSVREWGLVYNVELEDYHTYFADGFYVHN